MYVLGINSAYHESPACLLHNGRIVSAVEEERFTRRKHAKSARVDNADELPLYAIEHCLQSAGISSADVAHIGYSLNAAKRLENRSLVDIVVEGDWGSPSGEERFYRSLCRVPDTLRQMGFTGEFHWLDHHLCHAASAFHLSSFQEAAVLTVDGIGETSSTLFAWGEGTTLTGLHEIPYPASLGFRWEKFAKFLGFTEYDACKVMGLAAYGDPCIYRSQFARLVTLPPDGTFAIDNDVLRFRVEDYTPLERLFGIEKREYGQALSAAHEDIAAALQQVTDEVVLHMVRHLYEQTQSANLCMAGGVALNCITNRVAFEDGPFTNLYVQPAAHDAGTAAGAALVIWHGMQGNDARQVMDHAYLGPAFTDEEIAAALAQCGLSYRHTDAVAEVVAELLSHGSIVGWFQGAMEFGPRALGNRSLLADPRDPNMREILNRKVKHREPFRPLAPSVLAEEADRWFAIQKPTCASDFMLMAYPARVEVRERIPAVVHVDGTSRIQTVRRETNSRYYDLIAAFFRLIGVPLVLNTSFNESEPIVCTPRDAVDTLMKTGIDYLAIGDFLCSADR
jgi:carbamoyltransferase